MPSVGQIVGGVVGAVIGYVASGFNPVGAAYGFTIGYGLGGYIDPETIPGPGLPDAQVQTSQDGIPIPIIWGRYACHGNIIQTIQPYEVTTTQSSGKGGGPEVEVTRRYQTFAIGVCEGPIGGVTRIWQNDKLVYDARSAGNTPPEEEGNTSFTTSILPAADHAEFANRITIYVGDETQLPDADLEADTGIGNQPAYRGLAYVVFKDIDITDFGSAIPQYKFEVNGSVDYSATSKPYPIDALEGLLVYAEGANAESYSFIEGLEFTHTPNDGFLGATLEQYENWPPEGLEFTHTPDDGTLLVLLESYEDWPPEGLEFTHAPNDGTLVVALVAYTNWPAEGLEFTHTPQDGTLV